MAKKFIKLNEHLIKIDDIENFNINLGEGVHSHNVTIKTKERLYVLSFKSKAETITIYSYLLDLLADMTIESTILAYNELIAEHDKPKMIRNPNSDAIVAYCREPLTQITHQDCCILTKFDRDGKMIFNKR